MTLSQFYLGFTFVQPQKPWLSRDLISFADCLHHQLKINLIKKILDHYQLDVYGCITKF